MARDRTNLSKQIDEIFKVYIHRPCDDCVLLAVSDKDQHTANDECIQLAWSYGMEQRHHTQLRRAMSINYHWCYLNGLPFKDFAKTDVRGTAFTIRVTDPRGGALKKVPHLMSIDNFHRYVVKKGTIVAISNSERDIALDALHELFHQFRLSLEQRNLLMHLGLIDWFWRFSKRIADMELERSKAGAIHLEVQ